MKTLHAVIAAALVVGTAAQAAAEGCPDDQAEGEKKQGKFHIEYVNGKPVTAHSSGRELVVEFGSLRDGQYELRVAEDGWPFLGGAELSRRFTVDTAPPELTVADAETDSLKKPVTIKGRAKGASSVTIDGKKAKLDSNGAFAAEWGNSPPQVEVVATDEGACVRDPLSPGSSAPSPPSPSGTARGPCRSAGAWRASAAPPLPRSL